MKKILLLSVLFICNFFTFALTKEQVIDYPEKRTFFYGGSFTTELLDKVRPLEGNAKMFLDSYDSAFYTNHELTDEEKSTFIEYYNLLPRKLQNVIKNKVWAIYFIEEMSYGGLTDLIFDNKGEAYCTLYFNIETFYNTMDDWLNYRENTLLKGADEHNKIRVDCSDEWPVFLQIFIHEACHVYDFINDVTPGMFDVSKQTKKNNPYCKIWKDYSHPVSKYSNEYLEKASYYFFGEQVPVKYGKDIVNHLSKTPFSTIYGAKNWCDDFAETVTFYYLQKKFGISYKITYIEKGKEKAVYNLEKNKNIACWNSLCHEITGM